MLLIISIDKRIHIDRILQIFIAPIVGSVLMMLYCFVVKYNISNLWIKTVVCVIGGVVIYGIIQILLKNELVLEMTDKILMKYGRK